MNAADYGDSGGSPALPRADVPRSREEVERLKRLDEAMRVAGPRSSWPTATCVTCRRPEVYVIRFNGRLHPHADPHDGMPCRDHNDYSEVIA